ncbi:MAG: phosphoribosylglycinamide formyltransferase, partial [Nanoarchaeota archaeon]|nr:phosphoribosylglycinamide formyltransferase [Nanoarchaeota archaeon]
MKQLVVFASGSGSNAENIITYFKNNGKAEVVLVLTPNPTAGVIERCRRLNVACTIFSKDEWRSGSVLGILQDKSPDLIVLAGFMWLVPSSIISAFPDRIINIHPALLPKYGGKGMYGEHVHKAVSESGDTETGITIHYINEHY